MKHTLLRFFFGDQAYNTEYKIITLLFFVVLALLLILIGLFVPQ
jgi:hypothetical protein